MRISVIIPAYNCERCLERAVASVLKTDYRDVEIVVVNDGSTDGTNSVAHRLQRQRPDVITLHNHARSENRGVSATRNLGIKNSTGELICFLDADDTLRPQRFDLAVDMLAANPSIDAVCERTAIVYDDVSETASWDGAATFGIDRPLHADELLRSVLRGIPWHTSGVLLRRQLLVRTGLFHENLSIAEDCHLWLRMLSVGRVEPGQYAVPVSEYHRHGSSLYQPGLDRKVDYLVMLLDFAKWLRGHERPQIAALTEDAIDAWICNSLAVCREQGNRLAAWRIARKGLFARPRLICRLRILAHMVYLAQGK